VASLSCAPLPRPPCVPPGMASQSTWFSHSRHRRLQHEHSCPPRVDETAEGLIWSIPDPAILYNVGTDELREARTLTNTYPDGSCRHQRGLAPVRTRAVCGGSIIIMSRDYSSSCLGFFRGDLAKLFEPGWYLLCAWSAWQPSSSVQRCGKPFTPMAALPARYASVVICGTATSLRDNRGLTQ